MKIDELLQKLNINKEYYENENGSYTIDLDDNQEFAKFYSKLDKADFLEEDDEASSVTVDFSNIQYTNDDFVITLSGDFEADDYKMIIREV